MKKIIIILSIYVIMAMLIFSAWIGCINDVPGPAALGCACPHPKFAALQNLVPAACEAHSGLLFPWK